MTKEIKAYIITVSEFSKGSRTPAERAKFEAEMLKRISFYQHERLIHLIVTVLFALLTILSLFAEFAFGGFLLLTAVFLVLLIPYVYHYYFLENSVQKLYKLYYKLTKNENYEG
ncbi:MAG: hypothetical protein LBS21_15775 [Clostridiales bacterium]|nr:hypothetical protein [Clostridiales bacterium]